MARFQEGDKVKVDTSHMRYGSDLSRGEKEALQDGFQIISQVDRTDNTYKVRGFSTWLEEHTLQLYEEKTQEILIKEEVKQLVDTLNSIKKENNTLKNTISKLSSNIDELNGEFAIIKKDMKTLIELIKPRLTDYQGSGRKVTHVENIR